MTAGIEPHLGVVIVNYSSHELLERNLVPAMPSEGAQAYVVDNFSTDAERSAVASLAEQHGWHLIETRANLGFGVAANAGTRAALARGADAVVLLNPDVEAAPKALTAIADACRRHTRSLVSPLIARPEGSSWFSAGQVRGHLGDLTANGDPDLHQAGAWLTGACLGGSAELWRELGGFDEDLFMYWEDVELSWRCTKAGGSLQVLRDVVVTHDVGGTQPGSGKSLLYLEYNCRNRLLVAQRHLDRVTLLAWLIGTPRYALNVARRGGGGRRLLRSPRPFLAVARGSARGTGRILARIITGAVPRGATNLEPGTDAVRLYASVRTAHLERLQHLYPAELLYSRTRYDYDARALDGQRPPRQVTRGGAVAYLLGRAQRVVEVNEPLNWNRWPDVLSHIAAARVGAMAHGRRTRVVTYCIGIVDPAVEIRARWQVPRLAADIVTGIAVRTIVSHTDRLAFGTTASRDLVSKYVGAAALTSRSRVFPALPTRCACTYREGLPRSPHQEAPVDHRLVSCLFVGAFSDRKGIRQLMAAWDLVRAEHPHATLHLVGKGSLLPQVQSWAALRPEVKVDVDPPRSEVHAAYRGAHVLVLLSQPIGTWREQVGLPIVEGLSHGLEIVTTDQTGLAGWLREHGHVVVRADAEPATVARALEASLRQERGVQVIWASLPEVDARVAADRWLFEPVTDA